MATEERLMLIVPRFDYALHSWLEKKFDGDPDVLVVRDRRSAQRRQRPEMRYSDRRHSDRRQTDRRRLDLNRDIGVVDLISNRIPQHDLRIDYITRVMPPARCERFHRPRA